MRKSLLLIAFLAPVLLGAEDLAPIALNSLPAPPRDIQAAQVLDDHGRVIGGVERVAVDASGKPSALSIRPFNSRTRKDVMVVSAAAASYDAPRNIIVAAVPEDRIAAR